MGNVVPILPATPDTSSAASPAAEYIEQAFAALKETGLTTRTSQETLARAVAHSLIEARPLVAEAPTGTGKTLAYLVGALAAAEQLASERHLPIVIATATKGLQAQIIDNDVDRLIKAGLVKHGEVVLAKGRQNYFCVHAAEQLIEAGDDSQADMFEEEEEPNALSNLPTIPLALVGDMLEHHFADAWDGDIDHWPKGPRPAGWARVAANSETCIGRSCPHYDTCPLFRARAKMAFGRIVVANQDLVLSDMTMHAKEIDPVLPFDRYLVVFDEAHHLPDKALGAMRVDLHTQDVIQSMNGVLGFASEFFKVPEFAKAAMAKGLLAGDLTVSNLVDALESLRKAIERVPVDPATMHQRFKPGDIPDSLAGPCLRVQAIASQLRESFRQASQLIKGMDLTGRHAALAGKASGLLSQIAAVKSRFSVLDEGLDDFLSNGPGVRWVFVNEQVASLHFSPVEGAEVLEKVLWNQDRVRPVLVSATLQDINGFERFARKAGLPDHARTLALGSGFPYRQNSIVMADLQHSPRYDEAEAFRAELVETLPQFIDGREGSLVLCSSWKVLRLLVPQLKNRFGNRVLVQGSLNFPALIQAHRKAIDLGYGSILVGVASLAEGLDLPGKYCTHVLITGIPFAAPTGPVEQEMADQLGREYFAQRVLPDAFIKLVQMTGRLMRRAEDRGRITMFDNRLFKTKYGLSMLRALPPFRLRKEHADGSDRPSRVHRVSPEENSSTG